MSISKFSNSYNYNNSNNRGRGRGREYDGAGGRGGYTRNNDGIAQSNYGLASTLERILIYASPLSIPESLITPVPENPRFKNLNINATEINDDHLRPYQIYSSNIISASAKLLAYLLFVPRQDVVLSRSVMHKSFIGLRADKLKIGAPKVVPTFEEFFDGDCFSEKGSIELAKIHLVAIHQIRNQIAGNTNLEQPNKPKFDPHNRGIQCKFGKECVYLHYSSVIKLMLSKCGQTTTFGLRHNNISEDLVEMEMVKIKLFPENCHCPYNHTNEDIEESDATAKIVFNLMKNHYVDIAWRMANRVAVNCADIFVDEAGLYPRSEISGRIDGTIQFSEKVSVDSMLSFIAINSIDNCSEKSLLYTKSGLNFSQNVGNKVLHDYNEWNNSTIEDENDVPYFAPYDLVSALGLGEPKNEKKESNSAINSLFRKTKSTNVATAEIVPKKKKNNLSGAEPPAATYLQAVKSDAAANSSSNPPDSSGVPIPLGSDASRQNANGSQNPPNYFATNSLNPFTRGTATLPPYTFTPPPLTTTIRSLYGSMFIPRMISDKFLNEWGFRFEVYEKLPPTHRNSYINDCLVKLCREYVKNVDPVIFATSTAIKYNYDPYQLFDIGEAYIAIRNEYLASKP